MIKDGVTLVTIIEIAILLVAPWPLYRLLSIPVFRRTYFCFALRVVGVLIAYTIVIGYLVVFSPPLLHVAATLAIAILVAERFRARPAFGARQGIPPGSLTLVPRKPWVDDQCFAKLAERYGPVFKVSHFFKPMICVIGPRRGRALLKLHDDRLQPPEVRFNRFIPRGFLRYMAAPDHDVYKKLLQRVISQSLLRRAEPSVQLAIGSGLQAMASGSA